MLLLKKVIFGELMTKSTRGHDYNSKNELHLESAYFVCVLYVVVCVYVSQWVCVYVSKVRNN